MLLPRLNATVVLVSLSSLSLAYLLERRRRRQNSQKPLPRVAMADGSLEGTEIILVRHGQTEWNLQGRIQGSGDSPLTEQGIRAAKHLANRLATTGERPTVIYASPIGRAWNTANLLAEALQPISVHKEELMRERSFGCLEGLTSAEQRERFPESWQRNSTRDETYAPPDGESRLEVRERAMAGLLAIAKRHRQQRILVVTHSGLLATLMNAVLNQRPNPNPKIRSLALPNTAINLICWSGEGWQLVSWGDVGEFAPQAPSPTMDVALLVLAAAAAGAAAAIGACSKGR